jgi:hypothetical protein
MRGRSQALAMIANPASRHSYYCAAFVPSAVAYSRLVADAKFVAIETSALVELPEGID